MKCTYTNRGVATKFRIAGTISGVSGSLPPSFYLSSDLSHFNFENIGKSKKCCIFRKRSLKFAISVEDVPSRVMNRGCVPGPPPPGDDAHACKGKYNLIFHPQWLQIEKLRQFDIQDTHRTDPFVSSASVIPHPPMPSVIRA